VCINARGVCRMRLLGVVLVLVCVSRAAAQTCAVGQVLVNSVCTYNDPALKVWYKGDLTNTLTNFGSWGPSGALSGGISDSFAKKGSGSFSSTRALTSNVNTAEPGIGRFTLSFWCYFNGTVPIQDHYFMKFGIGTNNEPVLGMYVYGNKLYLIIAGMEVYELVHDLFTSKYFDMWLHMVVVLDDNRFWNFFFNGTAVTLTGSQTTLNSYTSWNMGNLQKNNFEVSWQKNGVMYSFPSWRIDDIRIYNRKLSDAEIQWLYATCGSSDARYFDDTFSCCTPGYITVSGACVACEAGKYGVAGATACANCSAGAYSGVTGASACTLCPAGAFAGVSGATACTNCSQGMFAVGGGVELYVLSPG
jgi:hypothetical protein